MTTFTIRDLRNEVETSIDTQGFYDVDGIVDVIKSSFGLVPIDTITPSVYWDIVSAHIETK